MEGGGWGEVGKGWGMGPSVIASVINIKNVSGKRKFGFFFTSCNMGKIICHSLRNNLYPRSGIWGLTVSF